MKKAVPSGQGPVVEEIEWDEEHRGQWEERMVAAKQGRPYIRDMAFQETRNVLVGDTPTYTWGVSAIGVAFQSLDDLKREVGFKRQPGQLTTLPSGALPAVIGQEFFVVDDPAWSHEDLLKAAIEIATDQKYRGTRAALTKWQQRFLNGEFTDDASIQQAVKEMHQLLDERNAIIHDAKVKTSAHYTFRLGVLPAVAAGALLAGPLGVVAAGLLSATASALLAVGEMVVDEKFFKKVKDDEPAPAAFVQDVRQQFGWQ